MILMDTSHRQDEYTQLTDCHRHSRHQVGGGAIPMIKNGEIRNLTPKECFRLQGWTDDYFEKAQLVNSDSQLYKQAGNGVTVNVIKAIAQKMQKEHT